MSGKKLDSCKHCGSVNLQSRSVNGSDVGFVKCLDCLMQGSLSAWNTRPTLPDEAALVGIAVKELRKVNGEIYPHKDLRHTSRAIITALRPYLSDGKDKARIADLEQALRNIVHKSDDHTKEDRIGLKPYVTIELAAFDEAREALKSEVTK